ncbi:hypothetical protein VNO77_43243 [Canavalia gladiata]|uniref:Uncharacterized protein n=1 Tax=Canavalia gladiata TaxID=3824 RepID=A0AAN9JW46_CANGL
MIVNFLTDKNALIVSVINPLEGMLAKWWNNNYKRVDLFKKLFHRSHIGGKVLYAKVLTQTTVQSGWKHMNIWLKNPKIHGPKHILILGPMLTTYATTIVRFWALTDGGPGSRSAEQVVGHAATHAGSSSGTARSTSGPAGVPSAAAEKTVGPTHVPSRPAEQSVGPADILLVAADQTVGPPDIPSTPAKQSVGPADVLPGAAGESEGPIHDEMEISQSQPPPPEVESPKKHQHFGRPKLPIKKPSVAHST